MYIHVHVHMHVVQYLFMWLHREQYHSPYTSSHMNVDVRLVYNMTQSFALHRVATESAYKMFGLCCNAGIEIFLFLPSKSFYMHFWSQRNAAQTLES